MEIKTKKQGNNTTIEIDSHDALNMALDALSYYKHTLRLFDHVDLKDEIINKHYKQHNKKLDEYDNLVYKLQLACGFDPNEL